MNNITIIVVFNIQLLITLKKRKKNLHGYLPRLEKKKNIDMYIDSKRPVVDTRVGVKMIKGKGKNNDTYKNQQIMVRWFLYVSRKNNAIDMQPESGRM